MKAKLIREIPQREGLPYYFKMYEYECIECGAHYTRHQYSERINPYCGNCNLKHENQKQKERVARHEQKKINAVLEQIRAEIIKLDDINPDYPMDRTIHINRNEVLGILDKLQGRK